MRLAITGGTGFVGRHLARALVAEGHAVVLIARGRDRRDEELRHLAGITFVPAAVEDEARLAAAFAGCDGVAHLAGINRELGEQTYARVHVAGTRAMVEAARRVGVPKVLLLSFLRARPGCGSPYHESKWAAEEIVRGSDLDYTIVKAGMIYGRGDHMLDHLSHTLHTLPLFATVGLADKPVRPVAVEDIVRVMRTSLIEGRLSRQTVSVLGPEALPVSHLVRRVARVLDRRLLVVRLPVAVHYALAWLFESLMTTPLVTLAQVRMLAEGIATPLPGADPPPADLMPAILLSDHQIRRGLPAPGPFGLRDLRCCHRFTDA